MKITSNQFINNNLIKGLFPSLQPTDAKVVKLLQPVATENEIKAILPVLTNEAFGLTMDSYRIYVATYNAQVQNENLEIDKFNAELVATKPDLTLVQVEFSKIWLKKHNRIACEREYNELAAEFNADRGNTIAYKKIPTIKYATELVFMQMLHGYQTQLSKRATIHTKFDIAYVAPVPAVEINSHEIASFERNGVKSIATCKKTIRNHRNRLQQAGVLVDYDFQGHKKGVKLSINTQILNVFDLKTQKIANAENQRVNPQKGKELPDNEEDTRTIKDKNKIKENVENNSLVLGTPSAGSSLIFYRNTRSKVKSLTGGAAPKNVKVLEKDKTLSDKLTDLIEHPQELAENLTLGLHNNHKPLDIRVLVKEAYSGTMTKDEYKELVVQDFLKTSAKLYRGKNVYTGVWKKTINAMMQDWFKAMGTTTFNKHIVVEMLQEYRWRLNSAHKWFVSHKFNPLFPSDYFDLSRTDRKEVGFAYTKKVWNKHLKYQESKPVEKRKIEKKVATRKATINASKAVETKVMQYLKGKMDIETLYNFVATSHPVHLEKLSEITFKIQAKLHAKLN